MTELPLTRVAASDAKQRHIRSAIRNTQSLAAIAHIARDEDIAALTTLLSNPDISQPIYTLPDRIDHDSIASFIHQHLDERKRGEGLLMVSTDEHERAIAYYDIQVWPQWASCELGGAIDSDYQNTRQGSSGALQAFTWLFDVIGVDLICETASLDNVRTARLLDRIGFTYMGEINSKLPGGGLRPSRYWELTKNDWQGLQSKP